MLGKMPPYIDAFSFGTAPTFVVGANQTEAQITAEAETSFGGANVSAVQSAAITPSFAQHQIAHVEAMAECSVQLTKNCARAEFLKGRFDSSAQIMATLAMYSSTMSRLLSTA